MVLAEWTWERVGECKRDRLIEILNVVIMHEQHCWNNNIVHYCYRNDANRRGSEHKFGCCSTDGLYSRFKLLCPAATQAMAVGTGENWIHLIEQSCSLLLTCLFQLVNKLLQQWWLDNVLTTLCNIMAKQHCLTMLFMLVSSTLFTQANTTLFILVSSTLFMLANTTLFILASSTLFMLANTTLFILASSILFMLPKHNVVHTGQLNHVPAGQHHIVDTGQLNLVHAGQHNIVHAGQCCSSLFTL